MKFAVANSRTVYSCWISVLLSSHRDGTDSDAYPRGWVEMLQGEDHVSRRHLVESKPSGDSASFPSGFSQAQRRHQGQEEGV